MGAALPVAASMDYRHWHGCVGLLEACRYYDAPGSVRQKKLVSVTIASGASNFGKVIRALLKYK
jgi:hypothetical protein